MNNSTSLRTSCYKFDPMHTSVLWQCSHHGFSSPSGLFTMIEGAIYIDDSFPETAAFTVTIDINQLSTGIAKFDKHLKSEDFFDGKRFPNAYFESTKVEIMNKNEAKVSGFLTLHGISRAEIIYVKLNKIGEHPKTHKKVIGFSAYTTVYRSHYGLNNMLPGIADEVILTIQSEAELKD